MSTVRGSGEPTMEEILASIRRIIADEGPNPEIMRGGKPPVSAPTAAAPAAVEPILDLTEIMEDDGKAKALPVIPPRAAAKAAVKPSPIKAPPMTPQGQQPPAEPLPDIVTLSQNNETLAPLSVPEPTPARAPVPQAQALPPQQEPKAPPPVQRAPAPLPTVNQALLSQKTQVQANQALTELRRAAEQERAKAPEPQREAPREPQGLETLVLQALRPQLKAWLDQNLGPLVERIVREEVRRLTGQNGKS